MYFSKGIFLRLTSQITIFQNGNFPNVQFPKRQLPKAYVSTSQVLQAAIGGQALWLEQGWELG